MQLVPRGTSLPLPNELRRQVSGNIDKKLRSDSRGKLQLALRDSKQRYYDDLDTNVYRDYNIADLFKSLKVTENTASSEEGLSLEVKGKFAESSDELFQKLKLDLSSATSACSRETSTDFPEQLNTFISRDTKASTSLDDVPVPVPLSRSYSEANRSFWGGNFVSRICIPLQGPAPPGFLELKAPEAQSAIQTAFGGGNISVSMNLSTVGSLVEAELRCHDVSTLSVAESLVARSISGDHFSCVEYQDGMISHAASSLSFIDSIIEKTASREDPKVEIDSLTLMAASYIERILCNLPMQRCSRYTLYQFFVTGVRDFFDEEDDLYAAYESPERDELISRLFQGAVGFLIREQGSCCYAVHYDGLELKNAVPALSVFEKFLLSAMREVVPEYGMYSASEKDLKDAFVAHFRRSGKFVLVLGKEDRDISMPLRSFHMSPEALNPVQALTDIFNGSITALLTYDLIAWSCFTNLSSSLYGASSKIFVLTPTASPASLLEDASRFSDDLLHFDYPIQLDDRTIFLISKLKFMRVQRAINTGDMAEYEDQGVFLTVHDQADSSETKISLPAQYAAASAVIEVTGPRKVRRQAVLHLAKILGQDFEEGYGFLDQEDDVADEGDTSELEENESLSTAEELLSTNEVQAVDSTENISELVHVVDSQTKDSLQLVSEPLVVKRGVSASTSVSEFHYRASHDREFRSRPVYLYVDQSNVGIEDSRLSWVIDQALAGRTKIKRKVVAGSLRANAKPNAEKLLQQKAVFEDLGFEAYFRLPHHPGEFLIDDLLHGFMMVDLGLDYIEFENRQYLKNPLSPRPVMILFSTDSNKNEHGCGSNFPRILNVALDRDWFVEIWGRHEINPVWMNLCKQFPDRFQYFRFRQASDGQTYSIQSYSGGAQAPPVPTKSFSYMSVLKKGLNNTLSPPQISQPNTHEAAVDTDFWPRMRSVPSPDGAHSGGSLMSSDGCLSAAQMEDVAKNLSAHIRNLPLNRMNPASIRDACEFVPKLAQVLKMMKIKEFCEMHPTFLKYEVGKRDYTGVKKKGSHDLIFPVNLVPKKSGY